MHYRIMFDVIFIDLMIVIFDLQRLVGRFGPQVSVISIVVTFVYLIATPSKGSKKKR